MRAVVLARPVDWSETPFPPEMVARVQGAFEAHNPDLVARGSNPTAGVYEGSVVRNCAQCGIRCWVGPRSKLQVDAGALVGCIPCVVIAQGAEASKNIVSLGNPDVPRKP